MSFIDMNIATNRRSRQIRIASLNMQCGKKLMRVLNEFDAPHLAACDIILLQETETVGSLNQAELLALQLGCVMSYLPARFTRRGTHGLAILSKYPISDIETLALPRNELLINTRDRVAMAATITLDDQQLRVYNVHLDTRINAERRQRQLSPVIAAANAYPHLPTIIGGDFNTFSRHHTLRIDLAMSRAGFASPFFYGRHYTADYLLWRPQLDWIYARKLRVLKARVERDSYCSDHKPIWIDATFHHLSASL
ncbi:MAG: endonuclease/exonuclease/phosphatase family protein [Acidobacteriota bacterium]